MGDAGDLLFCIDTSALIDLYHNYEPEIFPPLWVKIEELIRVDRWVAPQEVLKELEKRDDELLRWARLKRRMFRTLTRPQIEIVQEIIRLFQGLVDEEKDTPEADPFVVALALAEVRGTDPNLFRLRPVVVSQELSGGAGRPRVPDVCRHFGIECVRLPQLFRIAGWRFQT